MTDMRDKTVAKGRMNTSEKTAVAVTVDAGTGGTRVNESIVKSAGTVDEIENMMTGQRASRTQSRKSLKNHQKAKDANRKTPNTAALQLKKGRKRTKNIQSLISGVVRREAGTPMKAENLREKENRDPLT